MDAGRHRNRWRYFKIKNTRFNIFCHGSGGKVVKLVPPELFSQDCAMWRRLGEKHGTAAAQFLLLCSCWLMRMKCFTSNFLFSLNNSSNISLRLKLLFLSFRFQCDRGQNKSLLMVLFRKYLSVVYAKFSTHWEH